MIQALKEAWQHLQVANLTISGKLESGSYISETSYVQAQMLIQDIEGELATFETLLKNVDVK